MSLVYQALKQTQQQSEAAAAVRVRPAGDASGAVTSAVPAPDTGAVAAGAASARAWQPILIGVAVAVAGLGVGLYLAGKGAATTATPLQSAQAVAEVSPPIAQATRETQTGDSGQTSAAPETPATPAATAANRPAVALEPLPVAQAMDVAHADIPATSTTALKPAPAPTPSPVPAMASPSTASTASTASPAHDLKMAVALSVDPSGAAATPAATLTASTSTVSSVTPSAAPAVKSEVSIRRTTPPTNRPPVRDIASLFDAMNQALALGNQAEARQQLDAIEASLPDTSLARWRAQAWYAHQTGDTDKARTMYRKVLGKLQGDEYAALNLATIERLAGQGEQAREVLVRASRNNPDSTALRAALAQLSLPEARAQ